MSGEAPPLDPESAEAAADRAMIAGALDRLPLTKLHVAILALCTMGLAADIGEVALSNTFSALLLAPPYNAPRGAVSLLLAAVFAGGAIGAPLFGWLADKSGRRAALQLALVVLVFGSSCVAASPDIGWMTAFRFVSGLALGGYPPLTAAYLADILPAARRGALMTACAALAFLGAPAAILLIRWLTPTGPFGIEGWRWAFIAGALLAAATAGLFFLAPQSPRWLAARGRIAEAKSRLARFGAAGAASPLAPAQATPGGGAPPTAEKPRHRRRIALLIALYALAPWATIGFPMLSAAVMVEKGFRVSDSLMFAGLSMFGPTVGVGAAAFFIDRIERRAALTICAGLMAALGLVFAAATGFASLVLLGAGFNLISALYSAVLSLYGAELFPTVFRASATSVAWSVGRVVSGLVPIALLALLAARGQAAMFGVIAAALLASLILVLTVGPKGLAGKPVD